MPASKATKMRNKHTAKFAEKCTARLPEFGIVDKQRASCSRLVGDHHSGGGVNQADSDCHCTTARACTADGICQLCGQRHSAAQFLCCCWPALSSTTID